MKSNPDTQLVGMQPAVQQPAVQIRLLGELTVRRRGQTLALPPSKKTRALLAYLAAIAKPHLREHLCELLWDGPDDPRAQLRWSLTKLRPLLDDDETRRLRTDRDRLALDVAGVEVDLEVVRAAARRGLPEHSVDELSALADRFTGTFLEGLELSSCYRFHAWCIAVREEMHALHVAAVGALIARLRAVPERGLRHARVLLALDPLAESSHITVVRLLNELGRPREALEQYERCRQLLAHELGGKPSRELEELRMAIGRGSSPGAGAGVSSVPPAPDSDAITAPAARASRAAGAESGIPANSAERVPLIGRALETAVLEEKFQATVAGRGNEIVLLVGDAGIGKSRLLEELAAFARRGGGQVLSGRAFECELVRPYGAWIDALRSGVASAGGEQSPPAAPEFLSLLPEMGEAHGTRGEADRGHVFEAVTRSLIALARSRGPLLVLLDDIQWLDEASAALLHFVARALGEQPVLIACAARDGELSDNPGVLRLVRALARDRRLHRLPVAPLEALAIAQLVATVSRDVDAQRVFASSEGNPLFALEMARAHEAGERADSQHLHTLRALLAERLDRLDEKAHSLLPFAAAMGRSFDPRILASVLDMQLGDFFAALEDLERRSVLRASGPDRYDFCHDLIRQVAYQQLSEPRRRLIHLQLARVLSTWPDPEGDLTGDVAHHAALGGDSETAARAYLAAAHRCVRLFAWGEASELGRRGLQQLPRLGRATRLHLHIELLGVEVLGNPSPQRAREVEQELLRVLAAAEEAGLHADAARGHYLRSVLQFRSDNHRGAAETSWRSVLAGRSSDALTAARSQAEGGRCLILLEREVGKAKALLEEAHATLPDQQEDLILNWGLGLLRRYTGEPEEAAQRLQLAADLARRIESHWEETECLRALILLSIERRDFAAARASCPAVRDLAVRMGEGSEQPIAEALDALTCVLVGGADAAVDDARLEAALAGVRAADAKAMLATLLNVAAEHDLANGKSERAGLRAAEALVAARAVERVNQIAIACATLARLAGRAGDGARAQALLEPLRADLAVPFALSAHARATVEGALGELAGVARAARLPRSPRRKRGV